MRCFSVLFALVLLVLPLFPACAQDVDGDGLDAQIEETLGTDADFAETLDVIATDKTKEQGDRVGADNYAPGLDVTTVALGNVAGNRWLWRIDFAEAVLTSNLGLIVYLQADNDEKTGRKDARGIDYMLVWRGGNASVRCFAADGKETSRTAQAAVVGNHLYLCADLDLMQSEGKTLGSAWVLVETLQPYKMVDSVDTFRFTAQGQSDRQKVKRVQDATASGNVLVTWGLDLMRALPEDRHNVRLPIDQCSMHGFKFDDMNEYHMPSARVMEGAPYTVEARVPAEGRYYPAFIAYDCAGRQVYTLSVNGKRQGVAVASADNNRQALFVLEQPLQLAKGDTVCVELVNAEGSPRMEDLWLLATMPEIRKLPREMRYLKGESVAGMLTTAVGLSGVAGAPTWQGRITFVTTWPAQAKVEYGLTDRYGEVLEETQPVSNHRFWLRPLGGPTSRVFYRVSATTPEGAEVVAKGVLEPQAPTADLLSKAPSRGRVPLTVRNEHPVAVKAWPVTQGVPFAQGQLIGAESLRLVDQSGRDVPLAAEVRAWWPDGSVKWALLDFQTDLAAQGKADFSLEYGTSVRPSAPSQAIALRDSDTSLMIDAGLLQVELRKDDAGFPGRIWLDKNHDGRFTPEELVLDGGKGQVTMADKTATVSARPSIQVLSRNALHVVVRVSSSAEFPEDKATLTGSYDLHVYLNQPFLRVLHTWTNTNTASEWTQLQSWDLMSAAAVGADAQVAAGGLDGALAVSAGPVSVDQPFDNAFAVTQQGGTVARGEKAGGWLDLSGSDGGVTVALRDFWQLYPKRLTAGTDSNGRSTITVGVMPRFAPGTYRISKEGELEDKLFYYLKDDVYRLRQGVGKRDELLYYLRGAGESRDQAVAVATVFQRPPLAVAPKEWYCDSKAFTDVLPSSPELGGVYRMYEDQVAKALEGYLKNRRDGREYGMLNFGDWWGERGRNWGNIEYDTQHGFYLQFVRSGDPDFLYVGEEACRHNMDVDVVRSHSDPGRVGCVYAHCIGHTGGYYDHSIGGQATPSGGFSVSHTWVEGYLDDYFLTGDLRGLETARMVADHYDSYYTRVYDYDNGRTSGWHLILTLAMYRATGDPYYLNAAHIVTERVKEREMPEGGWARQMMPGHCYCTPRHRGEAAFMVGVLLTGLKDYHEITGDPRTAGMIIRGARNIIKETWVPERNAMRYTSCPQTSPSAGLSTLITEGILYGYGLSGDPQLGEVALGGTLQGLLSMGGMGKGFSQQIRVSPHFLYQLRQLRLTETAVELPAAPAKVTALINGRDGKGFELILRPWGKDGHCKARVLGPDGVLVGEVEAEAASPATPVKLPTALPAGVYTLELAGTGTWGLDTYLTPVVLKADGPLSLPRRPLAATYFVSHVGEGAGSLDASARTVGDLYVAPLERARNLLTLDSRLTDGKPLSLTSPYAPLVALWSQFWFHPEEPVARPRVQGLVPSGGGRMQLDATASTAARPLKAEWAVDGRKVGEGMTLALSTPAEGDHLVKLEVRDDRGLSGAATLPIRVPPKWVLDLAPEGLVTLEAENFSGQTGGQVETTQRVGGVGKIITKWEAVMGHAVTWEVEVPQEGLYSVVLKYCTGSENAVRELKIDGSHPDSVFARIALPYTGGYSTDQDNWRYLRIEGADGKPAPLRLTRGRHQLSMGNLGGGCALDQILLVRLP
jgi:hypothetical protein